VGNRYGLAEAELDELLQEIRIRVWRAQDGPENIDGISATYVYRTAATAAVDLIRRRRTGGTRVPLNPNLPSRNPSNPEREQEARELAERVAQAVEGLDDRRRPAVRMYLAGYGYREVAETLGWSPGATRNLLYRGLAQVREELAGNREGAVRE
jgi:RNA polymerase sigma-70 factor (ECF subfamily)